MFQPDSPPLLTLNLPPTALAGFASLLQHGILVTIDRPVPLVPFLLSLPGFSKDYIEQTVQTIFINGVAADSLDRDLVAGTTLALSAAMPGLAGAIFRRQGIHASLRSRLCWDNKQPASAHVPGFITLKLFNRIAADRVADLLSATILVSGKTWNNFATMRTALFAPPAKVRFNDQVMDVQTLLRGTADLPMMQIQALLIK